MNNLPPFYIGQKVVYITGNNMPKDSIHIIRGIIRHSCGCSSVDIGRFLKESKGFDPTKITCGKHKQGVLPNPTKINYFQSTSFRPLQQQSFPLITYSKVLEEQLISTN